MLNPLIMLLTLLVKYSILVSDTDDTPLKNGKMYEFT